MSLRIAHLSDLHLGFRAYPGTERGWNRRERDVADAFHRALQSAARLSPDLVVLTGDLFHRPDPPSTAFLSLVRGVRSFQALLPSVPILAIAGERDTPRRVADPGPVAVLDALAGVDAAAGAARAVRFREKGIHALLVPHRAVSEPPLPELGPDRDARFNLLLIRGEPEGPVPSADAKGQAAPLLHAGVRTEGRKAIEAGGPAQGARSRRPPAVIDPGDWDYIAVGGPHRMTTFAAHACAAGSLERIGWDPWMEGTEEKGFLLFDLGRREAEFHRVKTRPVIDLAPVRCDPGRKPEGTRRLRHLVEAIPGGIGGRLLRIRLEGELAIPEEGVESALLEGIRRRVGHLEVRTDHEPGPGRAHPASESSEGVLDPGLYFVVAPTRSAVDEAVAQLRAAFSAPFEPKGGDSTDEVGRARRVLATGGGIAALLDAARLLLPGHAHEEATAAAAVADEAGGPSPSSGNSSLLERKLRTAREDSIEAEGEAEASTFEWARERQEAETRLREYRDRAHELRDRLRALDEPEAPCPTCGRVLGDGRARLRAALQEEWEMVVQDGKWWKRRREQLDDRPDELVRLEGRARRLRAETGELQETLRQARSNEHRAAGPHGSNDGAGPSDPTTEGEEVTPHGARWSESSQARRLFRRTGSHLRFWTEGRLSGVVWAEEGRLLVVDRESARAPSPDERGALALVLHLALREEWQQRGGETIPMLVSPLDDRGLDLLLPLLRPLLSAGAPIIVALPPSAPLAGPPGTKGLLFSGPDSSPEHPPRPIPLGPGVLSWRISGAVSGATGAGTNGEPQSR